MIFWLIVLICPIFKNEYATETMVIINLTLLLFQYTNHRQRLSKQEINFQQKIPMYDKLLIFFRYCLCFPDVHLDFRV